MYSARKHLSSISIVWTAGSHQHELWPSSYTLRATCGVVGTWGTSRHRRRPGVEEPRRRWFREIQQVPAGDLVEGWYKTQRQQGTLKSAAATTLGSTTLSNIGVAGGWRKGGRFSICPRGILGHPCERTWRWPWTKPGDWWYRRRWGQCPAGIPSMDGWGAGHAGRLLAGLVRAAGHWTFIYLGTCRASAETPRDSLMLSVLDPPLPQAAHWKLHQGTLLLR